MNQIHLFGEMDLDLSKPANEVFKKAFDIAEACGYFVEAFSEYIDVRGEDCHDSIYVIYRLLYAIFIFRRNEYSEFIFNAKPLVKYIPKWFLFFECV